MAITVLLDPAQMPARTQEQKAFDDLMALLMQNLPTFGAQVNATEAGMNAFAAGGAYTLSYVFDSATGDTDPTAGKLRLSSATQNASTVIRLDTTVAGLDVASILDTFDASSSTVKGSIRLVKAGDLTKWLTFDVTARAAPTGYRNISVTNTGSSAPNPFTAGDTILLFFQRGGDKGLKGDTGDPGSVSLLATYTVGAPVAQVDFLNIFSDTYNKYAIEIEGLTSNAAGNDTPMLRLATGGAVDTGGNYSSLAAADTGMTTGNTGFQINPIFGGNPSPLTAADLTATVTILNARSSTRVKGVGIQGRCGGQSIFRNGFYAAGSAVSGFRLYFSASNISGGTVRVYGFKA
jgi:hypothetical protein